MLGRAAANEVLTCIDWGKLHLRHNLEKRNKTVSVDVRGWITYFFLAFLNSSDPLIIKTFLKESGKFVFIFKWYYLKNFKY